MTLAYKLNKETYAVVKNYYEKYNRIYVIPPNDYSGKSPTLDELERAIEGQEEEYPEFFGILDDIQFQSIDERDLMNQFNITLNELYSFEETNLIEKPYDSGGNIFEYIGRFTGYLFQCYGADSAYLFYNKKLKKAVMCLEYT